MQLTKNPPILKAKKLRIFGQYISEMITVLLYTEAMTERPLYPKTKTIMVLPYLYCNAPYEQTFELSFTTG